MILSTPYTPFSREVVEGLTGYEGYLKSLPSGIRLSLKWEYIGPVNTPVRWELWPRFFNHDEVIELSLPDFVAKLKEAL